MTTNSGCWQLVRQEVTIAEAAADHQVDRTTIMRIRTVAKEGALTALAASKPGTAARQPGGQSHHRDGEARAGGAGRATVEQRLDVLARLPAPIPAA
ncbi:MAG: hypothetical protein ACSLE7_03645 [Mycobacterium sp.]